MKLRLLRRPSKAEIAAADQWEAEQTVKFAEIEDGLLEGTALILFYENFIAAKGLQAEFQQFVSAEENVMRVAETIQSFQERE